MYNLFFLTTGIYLLGCKVATTDENAERPRTQASSRQRHEHVMIESWYVQLQVERDGSAATTHTDCDRLLLPVLLLVCKHWRTVYKYLAVSERQYATSDNHVLISAFP